MLLKNRMIVLLFLLSYSCTYAIEKADAVVVEKRTKTLSLYNNGRLLSIFPVVFGGNPTGQKEQEGDKRTPEGNYKLDYKKENSAFYKAIHISYPNEHDIASAKRRGVSPGGSIMIHGQRNGLGWAYFITKHFNWTDGCIALSNEDMETVWNAVDPATPITINP